VELEALNGGLTVPLLRQAMAGVSGPVASRWVEPLNVACRKYEITRSARRMAAFLGHNAKESGNLNHLEESLYYKDAH
jgi:predicted chitinase